MPRDPDAYLESLRKHDLPYVLIDHHSRNEADLAVYAANVQGGFEATKHLIDLGHTQISLMGWMDMTSAQDRLEGYKQALADCGLPLNPTLTVEGDFTQASGYHGAMQLLEPGAANGHFRFQRRVGHWRAGRGANARFARARRFIRDRFRRHSHGRIAEPAADDYPPTVAGHGAHRHHALA